jgi:RNA polymerase sigma-70 factor, ECF subfamily
VQASRTSIDAVFRSESPRLIAGLTRLVRDVGLAEELAQDALVVALEKWPTLGVPQNPGAWLMTTAKNRALDTLRKHKLVQRKHEEIAHVTEITQTDAFEDALDDDVGDDLLRLIFISCHPILSMEARVALTLRLLGGLTTEEIARAFLTAEATIAQRIVRAKRTLSEAQVPFELPRGDTLWERTSSVLGVLYLVFNEGYSATVGEDWVRPALCEDALRLGRILAELMPNEPEVHGLVALMEIQASRARARVKPNGEPIVLLLQDRTQWDHEAIQRGLLALQRAEALGGRDSYVLQAQIAACHGRARVSEETDWRRIVLLYTELAELTPSPVIELNRAVAVSMADGPAAALLLVDALTHEPALVGYPFLPAVRGDLLVKLGRLSEARQALEQAAALTRNARERDLLLARAAACCS